MADEKPIEFMYVPRPGMPGVPHRLLIGHIDEVKQEALGVTNAELEHLEAAGELAT